MRSPLCRAKPGRPRSLPTPSIHHLGEAFLCRKPRGGIWILHAWVIVRRGAPCVDRGAWGGRLRGLEPCERRGAWERDGTYSFKKACVDIEPRRARCVRGPGRVARTNSRLARTNSGVGVPRGFRGVARRKFPEDQGAWLRSYPVRAPRGRSGARRPRSECDGAIGPSLPRRAASRGQGAERATGRKTTRNASKAKAEIDANHHEIENCNAHGETMTRTKRTHFRARWRVGGPRALPVALPGSNRHRQGVPSVGEGAYSSGSGAAGTTALGMPAEASIS